MEGSIEPDWTIKVLKPKDVFSPVNMVAKNKIKRNKSPKDKIILNIFLNVFIKIKI